MLVLTMFCKKWRGLIWIFFSSENYIKLAFLPVTPIIINIHHDDNFEAVHNTKRLCEPLEKK